jgi:hypothetical protein
MVIVIHSEMGRMVKRMERRNAVEAQAMQRQLIGINSQVESLKTSKCSLKSIWKIIFRGWKKWERE